MGLFDFFDDVLEFAGDTLGNVGEAVANGIGGVLEGVEAVGRGIDTVVTTSLDVVGGGLDAVVDVVKENPGKVAVAVALAPVAMVATPVGAVFGAVAGAAGAGATAAAGAATAEAVAVAAGEVVAAVAVGTSTVATSALVVPPAIGLAKSFRDNVLRDKVVPVAGSVVYCDVYAVEHSGIYLGKGRIVHLNGSGEVEVVDAETFLNRLDGFNNAMSIYVSSADGVAVGNPNVARRARRQLGKTRNYNVIMDNCHQFASGCLTGQFDNADNFCWMLRGTAAKVLGAREWRVWDL